MSDKPSVVLVHGFWGGAAHWAKVIVELNGRGYASLHAVENPLTSLADDVERTQKMVKHRAGLGWLRLDQAGQVPGELLSGPVRRRGARDGGDTEGSDRRDVRRCRLRSRLEAEAELVSGLVERPDDPPRQRAAHG